MKDFHLLFVASCVLRTIAAPLEKAPDAFQPYHDYGEIRLAVTKAYAPTYNDKGSGATRDVAIYMPQVNEDFLPFGSIATASVTILSTTSVASCWRL
jgi:hypothetical protein